MFLYINFCWSCAMLLMVTFAISCVFLEWKCMGIFDRYSTIMMQILKGTSQIMIYAEKYHSCKGWGSAPNVCCVPFYIVLLFLYLISSCNSLAWISSFDSLKAWNELICTTILIALPLYYLKGCINSFKKSFVINLHFV